VRRSICLTADSTAPANRTNLFCLVVLVVDDAVTVLVEVVDKILSLFSGAISKQPLPHQLALARARFQLASSPTTLCKFSIK